MKTSQTPKWVLLTNSYGSILSRNYHFYNEENEAMATYDYASHADLFPTMRPWSEKYDRPIFNLLKH